MPISGVLLQCQPEHAESVRSALQQRQCSEVRELRENALVAVTDTNTLDEDRAEVEALSQIEGVLAAHVVFSSIEDLT